MRNVSIVVTGKIGFDYDRVRFSSKNNENGR